jgi:ABC-type transporter Mla subunit MlaD
MGDGININNNAGTFVGIGPGAYGHVGGSTGATGNPEVRRLLDELKLVVDRYADHLDDPDIAADAVAEAIASPEAEPRRLRTLLTTVKGAASGVTAVTEAANAVLELFSGIG